ncbi:DNA-binding CsgD family transcriptional regulator [Saonia flava]|uniref:DNA-binding CsgD family transcriptional regulator n=1 Tax=Saonia flava TaxID=523696 RepID=A0A846R7Y2_9FLAO|nr:helix-turn-helix transcriptional regulator [Saonia flava]NJB72859.1 DNA-binding CsgD family transcriptional regulator [Saonia flava]
MKRILPIFFLLGIIQTYGQYSFSGEIESSEKDKTVYLSIIEDYRKLSRVYMEQIIRKTSTDSLGRFNFHGENLLQENRIYRIHVDECTEFEKNNKHFLGQCNNSESILFVANNNDTILFPSTSGGQILCDISSTNPKSDAFLKIDALKEEMIYDFMDFRSEASKKLNSKKWFSTFQEHAKTLDEPLAELYIYDFLSDKRNETYTYYLQDFAKNSYYDGLLNRLQAQYPNTAFTQLYETEISTDKQLLAFKNLPKSSMDWKWLLGIFLGISVLLNVFLLRRSSLVKTKEKNQTLKKLTQQELKVVDQILADKTNKEIAADMFISLSTVKTHINNLYKKLNVSSREDIKRILS